MSDGSAERIPASSQRNPFARLQIGIWTIHWTPPEGKERDSTVETTEEAAMLTACKLLGGGIAVHYINGGRRIEREEIDLFCANEAGTRGHGH